jgi:hypothetical protein
MANDKFYGYKRNPKKLDLQGARGSVDLESSEEQREKATETIIKNLRDIPAYYSMMEHYETTTRNIKGRKPSFKSFIKEFADYSMKEIKEKFTVDKMKEIKLKESIRREVRNKINELFKIK